MDWHEGRSNCIGASQASCLELQSLVKDDNDEVIVFEPLFDSCFEEIKLAGGYSQKAMQE